MTNEEVFQRLAAPFDESEVKTLPKGKSMRYITARTVRKRLNEVLGPAGWFCHIEAGDRWVRCMLTIVLPEGKTLTREALGGYPKMPAEDDAMKGGDSDAFKRAAATFGVGEYLCGDETAYVDHRGAKADKPPEKPADDRPFIAVIDSGVKRYASALAERSPGEEPPLNTHQVVRHLLKTAVTSQLCDDPGTVKQAEAVAALQVAYESSPVARKLLRAECSKYLKDFFGFDLPAKAANGRTEAAYN